MVLACLLQVLRVAGLPLDSLWPAVVTHKLFLVTGVADGCKLGRWKSYGPKIAAFTPGMSGSATDIADTCSRLTLIPQQGSGGTPVSRSRQGAGLPLTNLESKRIVSRMLVLPPFRQCGLLSYHRHWKRWHAIKRKRWRRQTLSQNWHRGLHSQPEMFHTTMSPYTNQPTTLWGKYGLLLYHLKRSEKWWRNSHVLVNHGPLLGHLLGVVPSTFTMVYINRIVRSWDIIGLQPW